MINEIKHLIIYFNIILCALGQKIALQKCQEYSRAVYQQPDQIFSLRSSIEPRNISTCAIYENPLIVGGTPAKAREFPHMAVIGFGAVNDTELEWLCGGSLISEKHILTAAHCTSSQRGSPQRVRLGMTNLGEQDDYVQEVIIERFLNHPDYKKPIKYHDIAVLFVKKAVVFTEFVRPACLNTVEEIPYSQAKATGFGRKSYDDQETSEILLKVDLDIIPSANCSQYLTFRKFEMPQNLIKGLMCAGYLLGGRDTCQGDSGGPLQIVLHEPYCMYSIIGVTSTGRFCGFSNSPGLYTKVDQYISWIESTVWL